MSDLGNKKIMADNIIYYMNLHNKTRQDLCDDLGFKYTTVSGWVTAEKYPRIDKIEKMANYFGISKADLVERRQPKEEKSLDEQLEGIEFALWGEIKELTDEQKEDILNFVRFTKEQEKKKQK